MADVAYSFPALASKKIVGYLADLKIHISEAVLLEPKQHVDQVSMVFEKLVETTTGVTKEDMSQPAFAGLATLSHPELHDENISFMAFFRAVIKMMKVSKIDDFSLTDISDPTRVRLRRQLSAVINFCRFHKERKVLYHELVTKKEAVVAASQAAQLEHNKLVDDIKVIQERIAEKAKVIEEVKAECNAVDEELSQLDRTQAMVHEESSRLKKANHAAKDKVATAGAALRQAQVENERLQGQVVNSPQRILREVTDQKQALEQELADVATERRKAVEIEKSVHMLQKSNRDLLKAVAGIEEVATELNKQESAYREFKLTHAKILEKKEEYSMRASAVDENERKLHRFEEKLSHLEKQAVLKSQGNARDLEAVRLAIQQTEENWNNASARLKAREPVVAQLRQNKENLEAKIQTQREEGKQLLEEITRICRRHNDKLLTAMREGSVPSSTDMA